MPYKAKPQCGKGHDRPPGKPCPQCDRERALARYNAKRDEINDGRRGQPRKHYRRSTGGSNVCSKGHEKVPFRACQICRLETRSRQIGETCQNGHKRPGPGAACPECVREYQKRWHEEHREEENAKALARYYELRERGEALLSTPLVRAWRAANKERWLEQSSVDFHRRRARKAGNGGSHTVAEWRAICEAQENRCAHCGVECKLTKDHIEPIVLGGPDFAWNLQGLCGPCNSRKGKRLEAALNAIR